MQRWESHQCLTTVAQMKDKMCENEGNGRLILTHLRSKWNSHGHKWIKILWESNLNLSIMTSFFYFWPNFIVKEWRWQMLQADSNLCCPQEHQSISCTICFLFKAIHTNEHSLGCCCTELWRKSGHFCLPLHREDKSKRFIFKRQSFPSGRDYCIFFYSLSLVGIDLMSSLSLRFKIQVLYFSYNCSFNSRKCSDVLSCCYQPMRGRNVFWVLFVSMTSIRFLSGSSGFCVCVCVCIHWAGGGQTARHRQFSGDCIYEV